MPAVVEASTMAAKNTAQLHTLFALANPVTVSRFDTKPAHTTENRKPHDLKHGGPGIVANTWLEGTYSEIYPNVGQNARGMQRLFKQFSFPGGIPSHAAPETPG